MESALSREVGRGREQGGLRIHSRAALGKYIGHLTPFEWAFFCMIAMMIGILDWAGDRVDLMQSQSFHSIVSP